jgi:hypothetical protein
LILQRVLLFIVAIAALAAAAAVGVFAAAFALYAWVEPMVGRAGAAGVVLGAVALILLVAGLVVAMKAGVGRRPKSVVERLAAFVREKPLTAAAASLAAGFFAMRDPKTLAALLRELMEPKRSRRP